MSDKRIFLIDTDAGQDDAQAIMMALAEPSVEVIGITTVHGNTDAFQVGKNVLRILQVCNRLEIPVFVGTKRGLLGSSGDSSFYHGKDGFGDVPDPNAPDSSVLKTEHAVNAMIRIVNENPGKVTLICLGPLTNVAMAIRMDDTFGSKLKECYIMGGNTEGRGNITPCAEFNFHCDPEAAYVVLEQLGCPITMACWELCLKYSLSWEMYHHLRSFQTPWCKLLKAVEEKVMTDYSVYRPCDELAMAAAINNKIVTKNTREYATVEMHANLSRGQMVVDWRSKFNVTENKPNVTLIQEIDTELYHKLLIVAMSD